MVVRDIRCALCSSAATALGEVGNGGVEIVELVQAASVSTMAKVAILRTMSLRIASYGSGPGEGHQGEPSQMGGDASSTFSCSGLDGRTNICLEYDSDRDTASIWLLCPFAGGSWL